MTLTLLACNSYLFDWSEQSWQAIFILHKCAIILIRFRSGLCLNKISRRDWKGEGIEWVIRGSIYGNGNGFYECKNVAWRRHGPIDGLSSGCVDSPLSSSLCRWQTVSASGCSSYLPPSSVSWPACQVWSSSLRVLFSLGSGGLCVWRLSSQPKPPWLSCWWTDESPVAIETIQHLLVCIF